MSRRLFRWWWLVLIIPLAVGLARLRFDVEVLDLLPPDVPAVAGLKLYQQHFANARELIITVRAPEADAAESTARTIAERLRRETNLVAEVTWQPPWLEHPEQTAELIAHLWLNQPPEIFGQLANRLAETNLAAILAATREQLAMTLSPADMAQLSYDPFGLTRLPESVTGAAPRFGQGQEMFASADGTFRLLFVKALSGLNGYRECTQWFEAVKEAANAAPADPGLRGVSIGYTGRPAFVAEISGSMRHDITLSVGGTAFIIAVLFWLAHRRWKPMLWLLTLLALILAGTLALGGLFLGTINVVSMGFAAILLGLAVDYAVVHYQEALAHPDLSIPEIRRAIAPSIFWAAVTTITSFLVLNFGGLPGLAQLGSLVGVGVALSACVMIFAFLPPLFPDRRRAGRARAASTNEPEPADPINPLHAKVVFVLTAAVILFCAATLLRGLPKMDATANVLQPRGSQAYATLEAVKDHLNQKREPLWLLVAGGDESEVGRRLDAVEPVLRAAVSNHTLAGFTLPTMLWPRPGFQTANRTAMRALVAEQDVMRASALSNGFSQDALGLTESILKSWQRALGSSNVFWPTNQLCAWILEKFVARTPQNFYAVGFLYPGTNNAVDSAAAFVKLDSQLPRDGVWLSGWELLGGTVLAAVKRNLWKLLLPMIGLVLLSLWLAFRRFAEISLSLGILLISGLCLLAGMRIAGWSWNLLNLMALPLILGTGVDYSIFMQLALRRHHGDLRVAHRSVGRALLLCGGTAVSGFGSLALSSNAGMASLGQVCAVGIGCNMLLSVYLLPVWWTWMTPANATRSQAPTDRLAPPAKPSSLYRTEVWRLGLALGRVLPAKLCEWLSRRIATLYCCAQPHRREVVIQNLLPVLNGDRQAAEHAARTLFQQFAVKLADLWRYESGSSVDRRPTDWSGWEILDAAQARGKGVLLVTPHLGNWEFGGAFLAERGLKLLVLTQPEPGRGFTELRQTARARRGIETLVVGGDAFSFVKIIKRLQDGATVALLVDRPPPPTAVTVELFGRPFQASIAAAELARASGCAVVPVYVIRKPGGYSANILPEIRYDRAAIGHRGTRIKLTQEILRAFEPVIRQYLTQWYHFVPIWPRDTRGDVCT
ncbi:MAG: LpxL/LpxP family acyltransferase [Limisphaerales bacterium]